jgi:hypothetical protein
LGIAKARRVEVTARSARAKARGYSGAGQVGGGSVFAASVGSRRKLGLPKHMRPVVVTTELRPGALPGGTWEVLPIRISNRSKGSAWPPGLSYLGMYAGGFLAGESICQNSLNLTSGYSDRCVMPAALEPTEWATARESVFRPTGRSFS